MMGFCWMAAHHHHGDPAEEKKTEQAAKSHFNKFKDKLPDNLAWQLRHMSVNAAWLCSCKAQKGNWFRPANADYGKHEADFEHHAEKVKNILGPDSWELAH